MSDTTHGKRQWWQQIPLYVQILIALVFAVILGIALGAGQPSEQGAAIAKGLAVPCSLVLKALRALATPLILLAVLHSFLTTVIPAKVGQKLVWLLITNTLAAILIGLFVANTLQPGHWGRVGAPPTGETTTGQSFDPWGLLQDSIPDAIIKPLVDNNVIQLIVVALAFGLVLRILKSEQVAQGRTDYKPLEQVITLLFEAVIRVLQWVIVLVPLAVFGIVAQTIALKGFSPFKSLGAFVVAVLVGLILQTCFYLTRVRWGSWVGPGRFLRGGVDAFLTAFSTDSSTATMPVTYRSLIEKVGLRESSAAMGALVGTNFNNDGTALYEAMSALFIAQVLGLNLSLDKQLVVVLTSIFASVGAAGIPEAGLVTMTLVFTAVGLPTQYIAILLTVDWFLDRCRTVTNVMGDMTVSCLLDGKTPKHDMEPALEEALHPEGE
jgi:Na+/H+-dicarboxylate symporter